MRGHHNAMIAAAALLGMGLGKALHEAATRKKRYTKPTFIKMGKESRQVRRARERRERKARLT